MEHWSASPACRAPRQWPNRSPIYRGVCSSKSTVPLAAGTWSYTRKSRRLSHDYRRCTSPHSRRWRLEDRTAWFESHEHSAGGFPAAFLNLEMLGRGMYVAEAALEWRGLETRRRTGESIEHVNGSHA